MVRQKKPGLVLKGFTLIELLVTAFILSIITAALFMVLRVGDFSNSISSAKLSLQQEARNVIGWIVKDVRQTSGYQIYNNQPSADHIKFKLCQGHDGNNLLWSSNYIEYTYEPVSKILTRIDYNTGQSWQFYNIIASPFNIDHLANNLLIVTISVQQTAIGLISPTFSLSAEIKIRNG